jgi:hypothetical protein
VGGGKGGYIDVHQLFNGIQDYLVQAAEMKFHCFFLMPVVDVFPTKHREELEVAYELNLEQVFDVDTVPGPCLCAVYPLQLNPKTDSAKQQTVSILLLCTSYALC